MKTTTIKSTAIYSDNPIEWYLGTYLHLRKIRKVGDIETVNNYQLGRLNEAKANKQIDFVKVTEFVDDMGAKRHAMSYKDWAILLLIARLRKQRTTGTCLSKLKR